MLKRKPTPYPELDRAVLMEYARKDVEFTDKTQNIVTQMLIDRGLPLNTLKSEASK